MQIDKAQILQFIMSQGNHDQADAADKELPDQVDTDRDGGLLEKFGVSIPELISKFAGGGGGAGGALGGLGGILGGH